MLDQEFSDLPEQYRSNLPEFKEFYRAVPTPESISGTRGRTGVFEILRMNKEIEKIMLQDPTEEKVYTAARAAGMFTMRESAILKALRGEIPFEDINTLGGDLLLEGEASVEPPAEQEVEKKDA
jgi:type II secretory ATPase GspE/PulE/Tfp pilus assembly ATPase PilB-like protein